MSEETTLADQQGKFVQVVVDGRKRNDVDWVEGRLILSNKRLVLVSNQGKRTIPLAEVSGVTGRSDVTEAIAKVSGYLSVQVGTDVTLIAPADIDAFERTLYDALLDQTVVLVNHPAVEGGVVQDADWEKGRLTVEDDAVSLATASGTFVEIPVDDVGAVERNQTTVGETERRTVEIEHTVEGTSVETHVAGRRQTVSVLETYVRRGELTEAVDVDLTDEETEVLMALYTGVSPFQIPEFVGRDVEEVEEIYDRLVEYDVLEAVRTRREVQLEARGRSVASDAMADQ